MSDNYEQKILNFHGLHSIVYRPHKYAPADQQVVILQDYDQLKLQRILIDLFNGLYDTGIFKETHKITADHLFFDHFGVVNTHNYTDYACTIEEALNDFTISWII